MGYIEVFTMDENGTGWKDLSELSLDEQIAVEVEVALALNNMSKVSLACVTCHIPIPSGMGHCYCDKHVPAKYKMS